MEIGSGLGYASGPAVEGHLYLVCASMHERNTPTQIHVIICQPDLTAILILT